MLLKASNTASRIKQRINVILNGHKIIDGYKETVSRSLLSLSKYELAIEECSRQNIFLSEPIAKSRTIFILGSGQSINNLTYQDFNIISQHDSIGFNYWLIHDYTPTHYMFQWSPDLIAMLKQNIERLSNMNLLVRSIHLPRLSLSSMFDFLPKSVCLSFVPELAFHSNCVFDLNQIHILLEALSAFKNNTSFLLVPKFFATIGLIIPWAARNGYTNVILAGFDMDSPGYFWNNSFYSGRSYNFSLPTEGHAMLHASSSFMGTTIPDYLAFSSKWYFKSLGVNIYSYKCSNLVSKILPEYVPAKY